MYSVIKSEIINGTGRNFSPRPYPWVAKIIGFHEKFHFDRQFINGIHDYSYARKSGSRGIYIYWFLPPGLYEVYRPTSWRHEERFFIEATPDGCYRKIDKLEVEQCLKSEC